MDKPVIFLTGPTAAGKSGAAVELALQLDGEIVSADSAQVYRGMDIGTAKLPPEERRGVPHHLLDILDVTESWDAARFRRLAIEAIAAIRSRNRQPLVAGGSGLYVRAVTRGLFDGAGRDEKVRSQLEQIETTVLRQKLVQADPAAAARISANDRRRMIRALECHQVTGQPISAMQTQWAASQPPPPDIGPFQIIGLERSRPEIYDRCNRRVDLMLKNGLVDEVRTLLTKGLVADSTAGQAIGYAEIIAHLRGEYPLDTAAERIKQRTRHFAKRQWTWFRREPGLKWLAITPDESVASVARRIRDMLAQ
ncbi:MAG: tRNA (adenosine(37)-N6)-dimethylallyltransferase MiaA [Verrucomicrobiae bacterium]|nr:tRNA (adenosine(37)-N6)-dimethylallyltransferase MiaA [Verrucomicrobiae bacterium]